MTNYTTAASQTQAMVASLFKSMYMQMAAALTLTGITAFFLSRSEAFMYTLFNNPSLIWIALFAELGVVILLSARVGRMSITTATLMFILYSVLTGVTFTTIFLAYDLGTIASTFFVTVKKFSILCNLCSSFSPKIRDVVTIAPALIIGLYGLS